MEMIVAVLFPSNLQLEQNLMRADSINLVFTFSFCF